MNKRTETKAAIILLMLILSMLLMSFSVSAATSYVTAGSPETKGNLGSGLWSDDLGVDYATYSRSLTLPKFGPLVDDLDGDGINEIVVFDNNQIKIFRQGSSTLQLITSHSLPSAAAYSPPIIFDIRPEVTQQETHAATMPIIMDTYIADPSPTTNFGTSLTLQTDRETGDPENILIKLSLENIMGDVLQVHDANLILNTTAEQGASWVAEVYKVAQEWNENQSTWNERLTGVSWSSAGGDTTGIAYANASMLDGSLGIVSFNITALVSEWIANPETNYGLIIKAHSGAGGGGAVKTFHSKEAGASTPRVSVTYTHNHAPEATKKEILVGRLGSGTMATNVSILSFNGSALSHSTVGIFGSVSNTNPFEIMVACEAQEKCMAVWNENPAATSTDRTRAAAFNSTSIMGSVADLRSVTTDRGCLPLIPYMSVDDVDNDGLMEYTMSMFFASKTAGDTGNDFVMAFILNQDSGSATVQHSWNVDTGLNVIDSAGGSCISSVGAGAGEFPMGKYVSSPLVFDMEQSIGNGLDIVIAFSTEEDKYIMKRFDSLGAEQEQYPSVLQGDGRILSNPFKMNAFPKHDIYRGLQTEACVLAEETDGCDFGGEGGAFITCVSLMCASEVSAPDTINCPFVGCKTEEFVFDLSEYPILPNISITYQDFVLMAGAVQNKILTIDNNDLDEVLTPFGVFELIWDTAVLSPDNSLLLSWHNLAARTATIQVDYQQDGRGDIIAMSQTNLYYFDDLFTNENAEISAYQISPCLDNPWKINTTVNVNIVPVDTEGDQVAARAILYNGAGNEQDSGWSGNFPTGTVIPFSFTVTETTPTSTLRMMARDSGHTDDADAAITDVPFSVSITGTETDDCTTIVTIDTTAEETIDESLGVDPLDQQDNVVINPIRALAGITKLGVLGTFLLFLLAFNVYALVSKEDILGTGNNMKYTLIILGIINIIALMLGVITSIIPFGIIVFLTIIGLLVLAFMFKDQLGGSMR